jgi:hypothetical protein
VPITPRTVERLAVLAVHGGGLDELGAHQLDALGLDLGVADERVDHGCLVLWLRGKKKRRHFGRKVAKWSGRAPLTRASESGRGGVLRSPRRNLGPMRMLLPLCLHLAMKAGG